MKKKENLILTGWGYTDYAVSAAVALKALKGEADVRGMSRRRLPEFLEGLATERGALPWKKIYILGVSLSGAPERFSDALVALKAKGVAVTWISTLPASAQIATSLSGAMKMYHRKGDLFGAVGEFFSEDVEAFVPYFKTQEGASADVLAYATLIHAAQFYYRNYQDETLYAKVARYLAQGVRPEAWDEDAQSAVAHYERYGDRELLGASAEIKTLRERINHVAKHDQARVLILGESGTGKETVAQQIHTKSPRREMPFVAFNCACVTRELLEDRLFGHERGAFTNAVGRTDGLFLQADGGTLFLDEIGEMPLELQALLLRVLEGGRFMRVGGTEELRCDVRLITATNRDLPRLVVEGKFREDLYYRLNVVQLRTPSLREHKADIPIIANAWWRKVHNNAVLAEEQIKALMDYDYPGNVRELINILDRATALDEHDFDALMREHKAMNAGLLKKREVESGEFPDNLQEATRLHVRHVCEKYGKNLTHAANALGIARNTLKKYL